MRKKYVGLLALGLAISSSVIADSSVRFYSCPAVMTCENENLESCKDENGNPVNVADWVAPNQTLEAKTYYFSKALYHNSDPLSDEGWCLYNFSNSEATYLITLKRVNIQGDNWRKQKNGFVCSQSPCKFELR